MNQVYKICGFSFVFIEKEKINKKIKTKQNKEEKKIVKERKSFFIILEIIREKHLIDCKPTASVLENSVDHFLGI